MQASIKTAILIQSFWKNQSLAEETHQRISKMWANHPPVYVGGCDKKSGVILNCSDVEASWMTVAQESVQQLKDKDIEQVYLILEDHPPLNPCNDVYLNETLPNFMRENRASYIGLRGPDQRTHIPVIKNSYQSDCLVVRGDPNYLCNLSLHPGLWEIDALLNILESFIQNTPKEKQTAWYFEKRSRDADFIDTRIKESTYRVVGSKRSINQSIRRKVLTMKMKYFLTGKRKSASYKALGAYYEGPYPMVFAGLLTRGKPNPDFQQLKDLKVIA